MDDASSWEWVASARQYRYAASGRFLAPAAVAGLRDLFVAGHRAQFDVLAADVAGGRITVAAWERAMRSRVRAAFVAQYALGRGGLDRLATVDRMRLGTLVAEQFVHLHGFAADLAEGTMSEAQVAARSQLYAAASTRAQAEGYQRAHRGLALPAMPGDHSTACLANCRCRWSVVDRGDAWHATWHTSGGAAACADCRRRAAEWAPLAIEKT